MTSEELIEELKKYPGTTVWIEGCDCDAKATGVTYFDAGYEERKTKEIIIRRDQQVSIVTLTD